ncbi:hypothetical protein VM98_26660 [Streptomyces rubellomurinus subsp. indigoferus]|nr:hypothetical protein VM98_26660 [Streptomyces rubellomurinus subsp. indigoferus]
MSDFEVLTAAARPYLAVVRTQAAREGLPVGKFDLIDDSYESPAAPETEGWIDLDQEAVARRYGPKVVDLTIFWDSLTGWNVYAERLGGEDIHWWMGAGLVPAPERVTAFIATVLLLDYTMTGSEERPFYRRAGEEVPALVERLRHYGS